MKKSAQTKIKLLKEAREMAKDLHRAAIIDVTTMREFDALCVSKIYELPAVKIKSAGINQVIL